MKTHMHESPQGKRQVRLAWAVVCFGLGAGRGPVVGAAVNGGSVDTLFDLGLIGVAIVFLLWFLNWFPREKAAGEARDGTAAGCGISLARGALVLFLLLVLTFVVLGLTPGDITQQPGLWGQR